MLTVRATAPLLAAAAALTVALAVASPAQASLTPRQILSDLAANQTHSWIDNSLGFNAQTARYKAGERINVTCGYVSEVARRLLVEAGYTARVVQTITREPFDGLNDGHAMIEVFADRRWHLYDVDANSRAVDENGQGVSLLSQITAVREGRALWEPIASDPLFREDEPDAFLREAVRRVFADPPGFYRRIMGTAFFPADAAGTGNDGVYYIDADQTERLRAAGLLSGRYLATPSIWFNLTGVSTVTTASSTTAAAAVTAPSSQSTPTATVAVAAPKAGRPCQRKWRRYQRVHTRRAYVRYKRCLRRST